MADLDPHVSELIRVVKEEIQGIHPNGTFGPGTIASLWKTIDAIEAPAPSQPPSPKENQNEGE